MITVVKHSGETEPFDAGKIQRSILKAAIDAGISPERIRIDEIVKQIERMARQKNEIETREIRANILAKLDSMNKSVANSWRRFDTKYKL